MASSLFYICNHINKRPSTFKMGHYHPIYYTLLFFDILYMANFTCSNIVLATSKIKLQINHDKTGSGLFLLASHSFLFIVTSFLINNTIIINRSE